MTCRIAIVGGGSNQWVPKLVVDLVNTPSLADAHIVLEDIDPTNLPRMQQLVEHCARGRGIGMTVATTTDLDAALSDADFVVVSISTGGFASMAVDLAVPARHGLVQTVGDTVGPGGISRALRNVPVLVGIARAMEARCPDAWLLNLTNPMTTLTRAVTRETSIRCVGLCHEVPITSFFVSLLLGVDPRAVRPTVIGVNHLPVITALDVDGRDGLVALLELVADDVALDEPLLALPDMLGVAHTGGWTKRDLLDTMRVKLALLRQHGVLLGAGDRHLVEFLPELFDDEDDLLARWNVRVTTIDERRRFEQRFSDELDGLLATEEVSTMPSGELLAAFIDSAVRGRSRDLVVNVPNEGQAAGLPDDVVVECVAHVDESGITPGIGVEVPVGLASRVERVVVAQELTVEAALTGRRAVVDAAMAADPLAGSLPEPARLAMTDELLAGTRQWLAS